MSEWKECIIGDLGKIITGKTPRTAITENYGGNVPFLSPSDNMEVKYVDSTIKTLTEKGVKEVKNCLLPKNSVCVSCIGSDLGKVLITTKPTVTNQQINSIIVNEDNDTDFIYYLMTIVGKHLNHISKASTAVPIINKTTFSNYKISVPSLSEQKKIAAILSSLDDRIETNRKINARLEELAQAIFKSWFIDFEPFGGKMPKNWSEVALSDILTVKYGKDHKNLADGAIPVYGSGGIMRYVESPLYEKESILIPRKGTLNNILYIDDPFWSVDTMFFTELKKNNIAKYLFFSLKRLDFESMNCGSAIPSMTTSILNALRITLPSDKILIKFEISINPIFSKIKALRKESARLTEIRNILLPKLMSGEIISE